ncbi:hypothetical protein MUK42_09652 [Musa troglodytarum]|uniref:Uncharacterized protein n=1 Tax=Musa troglodytarum TaxID=320322 RepID=A0A9E7ELI3_9LILI|nr:hypothetical protein MUK42_09652 [Musa troglodytarum]
MPRTLGHGEIDVLLKLRIQLVENNRLQNGNREALTALRGRARTSKSSVPSPFETIRREVEGTKDLVKEICPMWRS